MLLHYEILICISDHSKFIMNWNLLLQDCFYITLLIIMFIIGCLTCNIECAIQFSILGKYSLRDILHFPKQSISIVFILFFFSSVNDSLIFFDEKIKPRKTIVWLELNTDFSVLITKPSSLSNLMVSEILLRQSWYVSPWIYESSTYTTELWPRLLQCPNGTLDILVKTLISRPNPFGLHVNWNKSSNVNLKYFWWTGCIGTEKCIF